VVVAFAEPSGCPGPVSSQILSNKTLPTRSRGELRALTMEALLQWVKLNGFGLVLSELEVELDCCVEHTGPYRTRSPGRLAVDQFLVVGVTFAQIRLQKCRLQVRTAALSSITGTTQTERCDSFCAECSLTVASQGSRPTSRTGSRPFLLARCLSPQSTHPTFCSCFGYSFGS